MRNPLKARQSGRWRDVLVHAALPQVQSLLWTLIYPQWAHRPKQYSLWKPMLSWKRIVSPASRHTSGLGTRGKAWVSLKKALCTWWPFCSTWSDEKSPATSNRTKNKNQLWKMSSMWKHPALGNAELFCICGWFEHTSPNSTLNDTTLHQGYTGIESHHTY